MAKINSYSSVQPIRANFDGWKSTAPRSADTAVVSNEAIALRAYELYVARGRVHGFDREDWATASRELMPEVLGQ